MITVKKEGVILTTTDLEFENEGVLNPAVVKEGNNVYLLYRAVRKGNYSTIGYCKLDGPLKIAERLTHPFLSPQFDYEKHGMEDPRMVKMDDTYYLTYIAFDGDDALGALATSTDLKHFEKHGVIVPKLTCNEFDDLAKVNTGIIERYRRDYYAMGAVLMDKDVVFFPRRINGKLTFLHRIKPDIQIVAVDSLDELTADFWKDYFIHLTDHILLTSKYQHEINYVGGGCPPVETPHGWLVIYHGVQHFDAGYDYSACAALFELDDPKKEIARLPYPLFKPDQEYELAGDVDNVCFPTGTALFDDTLYIYYGAGDDIIACASVSLSALVTELLSYASPQSIA
ncbi:MAG: pesticidal protein Cry7Aa [Mucilaginibacter sp.]|nr:pesticidal protein Cry7Aa [Mucilaginibacter sp.]